MQALHEVEGGELAVVLAFAVKAIAAAVTRWQRVEHREAIEKDEGSECAAEERVRREIARPVDLHVLTLVPGA